MKKKVLKLSFFTLLFFFVFSSTISAQEIPQPSKTEFIEIDNQKIPVFHFDDPEEADLHRMKWAEASQELFNLKQNNVIGDTKAAIDLEVDSEISPLFLVRYTYNGFNGTAPYQYKFNVYENRTNSTLPLTRTVTNSASSSTTIGVASSFRNVFQANVNKTFAKTATFKDTFKLSIPPKKQGEIWSWNYAEKYSFKKIEGSRTTNFTAWRPTDNYGQAVYYLNFRDPS